MSGRTPPPDVRFDHAAAAAAIDEAKRALGFLGAWMRVQDVEVPRVIERWGGRSRDQAEYALAAHTRTVSEIIDRLRLLVVALESGEEAARYEQSRRLALQCEWETQSGAGLMFVSTGEIPAGHRQLWLP